MLSILCPPILLNIEGGDRAKVIFSIPGPSCLSKRIVGKGQDEGSVASNSDCKLMKSKGVKNEFLFERSEFEFI